MTLPPSNKERPLSFKKSVNPQSKIDKSELNWVTIN